MFLPQSSANTAYRALTAADAGNSPWISTSRRLEVARAHDTGHAVFKIDPTKVSPLRDAPIGCQVFGETCWSHANEFRGALGSPWVDGVDWGECSSVSCLSGYEVGGFSSSRNSSRAT
jgi:hypothetical protein